jgi:predicted transcriptional regulator of viral defense system
LNKKEEIISLFVKNNGYLTLQDLADAGINKYHLEKLIATNKVERLKPGVFKLINYSSNELYEIIKLVPNGVICLYSAWNYYELTNYMPHEFHVAIERKSKIKLPEYPPVKLYYWEEKMYQTGIETKTDKGASFQVYALEKSVCDAVKFRNKIGKDILNEVLTEYLKRKDKNIELLIRFAKKLRVEKILKNYLEILL